MGKSNRRLIVVSFSREFDKEFEFIESLVGEGTNRSWWICNAIREKIKGSEDTLKNLEDRIKALEITVNNGRVIVEKIDADKDLVSAASMFEF